IDAEIERIERNLGRHSIELATGTARFADAHTVVIAPPDGGAERRVRGRFILIAVGSHPVRPAGFPWESGGVEDSDSILELSRLPRSLAVVGAGVIGCEYAGIFQQLNVQVTLLDRGQRLLPFLDAELSAQLAASFRAMGMNLVSRA